MIMPFLKFCLTALCVGILVPAWAQVTADPDVFLPHSHVRGVARMEYSPDGKFILSSDLQNVLWDVASGLPVANFQRANSRATQSVAFTPDSKHVLLGFDQNVSLGTVAELWSIAERKVVKEFQTTDTYAEALDVSDDGTMFAMGGVNGVVSIFNITDMSPLKSIQVPMGVKSLDFSKDNKYLLVGANDENCLWSIETGKKVRDFYRKGLREYDPLSRFSKDGTIVVTSHEETIRIWDAAQAQELIQLQDAHQVRIRSLDISPDGRYTATGGGDGKCKIWDNNTMQLVHEFTSGIAVGSELDEVKKIFKGSSGIVSVVRFSPDGKHLAAGLGNGTIQLWDVATRKPVKTLAGREFRVKNLGSADQTGSFYVITNSGTTKLKCTLTPFGVSPASSDQVKAVPTIPVKQGENFLIVLNEGMVNLYQKEPEKFLGLLYIIGDHDWIFHDIHGYIDASPGALASTLIMHKGEVVPLSKFKVGVIRPGLISKYIK